MNEPEAKVTQIVTSLSQPLDVDFRDQFERPLFKKSVSSLNDLKVGQRLTGRVFCEKVGCPFDIIDASRISIHQAA